MEITDVLLSDVKYMYMYVTILPLHPHAYCKRRLNGVVVKPFLVFVCFASIQNCETYPPAREKKTKLKKSAFSCYMDEKHNQNLIYMYFTNIERKYSARVKLGNND